MTDFLDLMFANALLTIPFAVLVAIVARWIKRPAAVHVLWMIVLLKLVSPHFYDVQIPGLSNVTDRFVTPVKRATDELHFSAASMKPVRIPVSPVKESLESASSGMSPSRLLGVDGRDSSENAASIPLSTSVRPEPAHRDLAAGNSISFRGILCLVWAFGTTTFFFMLCYRARRFHQFVKRAAHADAATQAAARSIASRYGLGSSPIIRVASGEFPPLLWVVPGSATIVLPQKLISELGSNAVRNLLAHELAHFARGDHWVRLLESVVLGICWWHPLAWWARRQLQHAEELCCDAWVMWAYPKSETEYARTLLATLDYLSGAHAALPPLASGLGRSNLVQRRFEMILHHKSPRRLSVFWIAATAIVAITILPWSTSVMARPQDNAVAAEAELEPTEEDSASDLERIERRVVRGKQLKQKRQTKQQKQKRQHSHASDLDVYIDQAMNDADLHRLIQSAIHRAFEEAHAGLEHAKSHVAEDAHVEVTRSVSEALEAFESVSEEEVDAIAQHIETAMVHFGEAVEKSADAFARVLETELETIEEHFGTAERDGKHISDLLLNALKAVESAGLSKSELQHVVTALDKALENVETEVEIHVETATDLNNSGSQKAQVSRKTSGVRSNPKRPTQPQASAQSDIPATTAKPSKSKKMQRDQQVVAILRQIKSLVHQLEEKVESNSDDASSLR